MTLYVESKVTEDARVFNINCGEDAAFYRDREHGGNTFIKEGAMGAMCSLWITPV